VEEKRIKMKVDNYGLHDVEVEFPGNSHKARVKKEEPKKIIKKVIRGKVLKKKKTLWRRLTDTLLGEEVESVSSYIIHDVLVPAAKNTLSDIVSGGIEMLLFGDTKGRGRRDRGRSYVSYSNYYKSDTPRDKREASVRNRSRHNFDDIVLDSRGEAEEVLNHLVDLVIDYEMASVADLYDLVGIESSYTDTKYGWINLSSARPVRVRDGYLLDLPRAMPLD